MPKDDRQIIHGIRVIASKNPKGNAQSMTYSGDMVDELAAAFTQAELDAMKERGDITGNWKSTKGKVAKEGSQAQKP